MNPWLEALKMYPQRVIVLINALAAGIVYYTPLGEGDMAIILPIINALLVMFYGERATHSVAYLNKTKDV